MPVLSLGSRGPDVRDLQRLLTLAGFPCIDDGIFGKATAEAVKQYQAEHGLKVDGLAGPRTMGRLRGEVLDDTDPAIVLDELFVDVSQFAGVPDYVALAAQGFRGVVPRIGTGTASVDTLAARQIAEGKAAGFDVPAGYSYIQSGKNGALQAEHAVRTAKAFGLPAVFADIEPAKGYDKAAKRWIVASDAPSIYREVAIECLDRLLALGFPFGVYGGDYLASLNLPAWVGALPLWNAAYGPQVHTPRPWTKAAAWQYAGNVKVGAAAVDYNKAFGGLAALRRALGTG